MIELLQKFILAIGLTGIVGIFLFGLIFATGKNLEKGFWNKNIGLSLLAAICIIIGGSKAIKPVIYFDSGLIDNGTDVNTNDMHTVYFRWGVESWVPPISLVKITAYDRNLVKTPADIVNYTGDIVAENIPVLYGEANVYMENEFTNYTFFVEHSYMPDAPIVTNGVYHIQAVGGEKIWIPIGLTIKDDLHIISPHKEKQ